MEQHHRGGDHMTGAGRSRLTAAVEVPAVTRCLRKNENFFVADYGALWSYRSELPTPHLRHHLKHHLCDFSGPVLRSGQELAKGKIDGPDIEIPDEGLRDYAPVDGVFKRKPVTESVLCRDRRRLRGHLI